MMYQVEPGLSPYLVFALAIAALNGVSFAAFAWDKHRAGNGGWRVPERTLLGLAAMGGSIGAVFGQILLRHKTRKEPFLTYLRLIVALQTFVLIILLVPQSRNAVLAFLL